MLYAAELHLMLLNCVELLYFKSVSSCFVIRSRNTCAELQLNMKWDHLNNEMRFQFDKKDLA